MHALVGHWLGDPTAKLEGRVSLNPLRHIDPFLTVLLPILLILAHLPPFGAAKPVQIDFRRVKWDEFGAAIIAAAGPFTNFLVAIVAALILNSIGDAPLTIYKILGYTVLINLGFAIFNLIPWPPLDGSRVLYAFAPRPLQEFMDTIENMGFTGLIIFMVIFYQFISPLLSNLIDKLSSGLTNGLL
jgi:Zn-dependent protease